MGDQATWIRWNDDKGTIESSLGRLVILAEGFVKGFVEELMASGGTALGRMIINDLGRDLDIEIPHDKAFSWDDIEHIFDDRLASFDSVENCPSAYGWNGKGRVLVYRDSFNSKLWPVKAIGSLKSSAERSLTVQGARAILGQASRRAGRLIGERIGNAYGWNTLEAVYDTVGRIMTASSSELGWGRLEVMADLDRLLIVFIIRNGYETEGEGKDARLTILGNQIEGVAEYLSEREGMKSTGREFTLDDGTDARAIVIVPTEAGKEVDWDRIGWREMLSGSPSAVVAGGM
jgi:hypothetical protein